MVVYSNISRHGNSIYMLPVGKWKDKASTRSQKLLEEFRLQLEL